MRRRKKTSCRRYSRRSGLGSFSMMLLCSGIGYFLGVKYPNYYHTVERTVISKFGGKHFYGGKIKKFLSQTKQNIQDRSDDNVVENKFPDESIPSTPPIKIDSNTFQVRFSPNGGCLDFAKSFIDRSQKYILVQGYSFTSELLAKALVAAHSRGVKVMILLDKSQPTAVGSQIYFTHNNGIPVAIDYVSGIAHNKIMIIDDKIVLTGSFNWTMNAEKKNAENLLMINNADIAKIYKENWLRRSREAIKFLEKDRASYERNERLYRKGKVAAAKGDYTMME